MIEFQWKYFLDHWIIFIVKNYHGYYANILPWQPQTHSRPLYKYWFTMSYVICSDLESKINQMRRNTAVRFTNDFFHAIQIQRKLRLAAIPLLAIRSEQILHMPRQRSWEMRNIGHFLAVVVCQRMAKHLNPWMSIKSLHIPSYTLYTAM